MHAEAFSAVRRLLAAIRTDGARVLELGSYDVNGSVRPLVPDAAVYVGLDVRDGPGVDVKANAATWAGDGEPFDLIICTEMLEHAAKPAAVIANALALLRPGGWLILTAAGPGRAPHSNDGQPELAEGEHYANISPDDLAAWLADWRHVTVEHNAVAGDVYAAAQKPRAPRAAKA